VFCGASGQLTKEHVIPKWVARALIDMEPGDEPPDWFQQYNAGGLIERDVQRSVQLPSVAVRAVCALCNNGWMSSLENKSKPVIEPMIRGEEVVLNPKQQLQIATWASKTVVAFESNEPTSLVTLPGDRDLIRTEQRPPAHHRVRLAARSEVRESMMVTFRIGRSVDAPDEKPDVFATVITLGFLRLQVWGGHGNPGSGLSQAGSSSPQAVMIWPPTPRAVTWPPPQSVDDAEFDAFATEVIPWDDDGPGLEEWRQMRRPGPAR
jgi:hypothetical protein